MDPPPVPVSDNLSALLIHAIYNENMIILSQPNDPTETTSEFNTRLEEQIVSSLAANLNADYIENNFPADFYKGVISIEQRATFDIVTTTDISDISYAISSKYVESGQVLDSKTFNIGTSNATVTEKIAVIAPSNSIYDSNVQFVYAVNNSPFLSTSDEIVGLYPTDIEGTIPNKGTWTAAFDDTLTNSNYHKSINSEYNTSTNARPMSVSEYDSFNQNNALGMDLLSESKIQNYYTLDSTTGQPLPTAISNSGASSESGTMSASYRLDDNGLYAEKSSAFDSISLDDCGSYRVQQFPDTALITIAEDSVENATSVQTNIANFPVFNANNSSSLPTNDITLDQFNSIFDRDAENIVPGYKFTSTVTEAANSGYSPDSDMIARTDTANTFTLDDSSLLDNSKYMEHYVNGGHTLAFAGASLSISAVSPAEESNISLFDLNSQRETIVSSDFQNGQIKTNNNSVTTRYTGDTSSTLDVTPNVYYNAEDTKGGISDEIKNNYYVKYLTQMVMKNSKDISGSFLKSNNCALDLFNNGADYNSFFNSSDFGFEAIKPSTAAAELVKIVSQKQLASINGFSSNNESLTPINFMSTFATVQNLKTLISTNKVFNSAKMLFTLNDLQSKSIYNAANSAGWSLDSDSGAKIVSYSSSAFANDNATWPTLKETKDVINGSSNINYSISIGTNTTGNSHLSDFVTINWNVVNGSSSNSLTFPQEMLTRVINTKTSSAAVPVTAPLTLTGKLIGRTVEVSKMTSTRELKYSFNLGLRQFNGLTMTTPLITSITHYYAVKDLVTGELYPKSYLQYVTDDSNTDYTVVTESFDTITSIQGLLTKSDMCDLSVKVQGLDIDSNAVIDFSNTELVSSMYGISHTFELVSANEAVSNISGDITVCLECEYLSLTGEEGEIKLDNVTDGYVIQLTDDYKANYTCYNWSAASPADVITNTDLASTTNTTVYNSLSVANGYSNITFSTDYSIKVSYELDDQSTTVLSVYLTSDATKASLYEIRTKEFSFPITDMYISNVPTDIFRMDRWIGQSATTNTFTERFVAVDYTYTNSLNDVSSNVFAIDTGVYLSKTSLSSTTFAALTDIGKYIAFTLKSDSIGVNMIGSVESLSPIEYDVLTFQYSDTSRILTIPSYRGYYGTQGVDQVYTITRDTMVATLSIARSSTDATLPSTISQSFNVYYNAGYTVDSLSGVVSTTVDGVVESTTVTIGSIGLNISFSESMLSSDDTRSFTIFTMGDTVSFTIVNPNATGTYNTAPGSSTLKTFSLYTFSGSDFDGTGKSLSINSYRLKIQTDSFDHTSAAWSVQLDPKKVAIYKNNSYLGNPENLDTNNAYVAPDSSKWVDTSVIVYTYNDLIGDGITVNGWTIKRTNTTNVSNYNPSVSFFVIMPPYLMFKIASSDTLLLPYTYSASDNKISYLPISATIDGKNTYTPFAASTTYSYINSISSVVITFDQSKTNNVTFVQTSPITLSDYSTSGRSVASQYFVVEANLLTMTLNSGLKESSGPLIATLFNNLPANRLMYCVNGAAHFYMDGLLQNNSGIVMKLLQPEGANTPYPDLSTSQTFTTDPSQIINANITLQIQNFFTLPSKAISSSTNDFKLDLPAGSGVKSQLYTREIINDSVTGNVTVFVYRYDSSNNVDYNDYSPRTPPAVSIVYLSRYYKTITLSKADWQTYIASIDPTVPGAYANAYSQFITTGVANINSVAWVQDASWPTTDAPTSVFTSLLCLNDTTLKTMAPQIFSTTADGKAKAVYVSKYPVMSLVNKVGQTVYQVTGWGSVSASTISTTQINLSDSTHQPPYGQNPGSSVSKIPFPPLPPPQCLIKIINKQNNK